MARETPIKTKPKGYAPIERTGVDQKGQPNKYTHGDPAYQIEKPDFEALRRAEMTVGDDGIRRTTMTKMGPLADHVALQQYRSDGYEVVDGGHEYLLSISQERFEELERARHDSARRMAAGSKTTPVKAGGKTSEAFESEDPDGSGEVSNKDLL